MLKCVFSRVLSREIENEDERDRRLFAFFETPTTVALISLILTRVKRGERPLERRQRNRGGRTQISNGFLPYWLSKGWISFCPARFFRSTLSFLANPLFKYILRLFTDSRSLSLVLFERYYTTERAKEKLRLVILVHLLRVFLPLDSFLATKSGRGV